MWPELVLTLERVARVGAYRRTLTTIQIENITTILNLLTFNSGYPFVHS